MTAEIISTGNHGAFGEMDPSIEILSPGGDPVMSGGLPPMVEHHHSVEPVHEERRPSMAQRMSSININDKTEPPKLRRDSRRDSVLSSKSIVNHMFHYVEKDGDSWRYARTNVLSIPQSELEKKVKKGKGKVLDQMNSMGSFRRVHIQRLADEANANEDGPGRWEVGWIEMVNGIRPRVGLEIKAMNVILAKTIAPVRPIISKTKSQSKPSGKVFDALEPAKEKKKDKEKDKSKGEGKEDKDQNPELANPLTEPVLFHSSGRPMDERGPIEFTKHSLPEIIPKDKPIGARLERRSSKRRSKTHDLPLGAIQVVDPVVEGGAGHAVTVDDILGGPARIDDGRGRRNSSRRPDQIIEVLDDNRRSHSRRRPSRSKSRLRSRSRRTSTHYPNHYTRTYFDGSSGSETGSYTDDSRYGAEEYERSSYTSQDTHDHLTRRGSLYHQDPNIRNGVYREHHRGPSRRAYYDDTHVVIPHRPSGPRRSSTASVQYIIPNSGQIEYRDRPRDLVRARTYDNGPRSPTSTRPILVYPDELVNGAESYMRDTVREEHLDQRERVIDRRERAADDRDWERSQRDYGRRYSRSGSIVDTRDGHYY